MRGTSIVARGISVSAVALLAIYSAAAAPVGGRGPEVGHSRRQISGANAKRCSERVAQEASKNHPNTTVLLVKQFRQGENLLLTGTPTANTPKAANDLCLVKLNVGPGNPGPPDAPSTSAGIGIEIWLPAAQNWNKRLHVMGGGGWAGGLQGSPKALDGMGAMAAEVAGVEGAVSASTDTGHRTSTSGSFLMNPDGSINTALWNDFSHRSLHEMTVLSKALAKAYYGEEPKYSYWEGSSTGGRQGMKMAQSYPEDVDGILVGAPVINWTRFNTQNVYPWIVFMRDLGGTPLTTAQQDLVSNAAIFACDVVGGQHLGFPIDPPSCKYDPTKDPDVLCASSGGKNATTACVTPVQAKAINKIWYGMTSDGSVPSPEVDNGWADVGSPTGSTGVHRWFGLTRGTSLYFAAFGEHAPGIASPDGPFFLGTEQIALQSQKPSLARPTFRNTTGNGMDGWRDLSYAQLSASFDRGVELQQQFGDINTDDPDLSAFKAHGGKLLHSHGLSDELVPPAGSVNYYNRVLNSMGGLASVQPFYRLFLIPGRGHYIVANGTANPAANPPAAIAPGQLYHLLTDWVEKGIAPESFILESSLATPVHKSLPVCAYPKKPIYVSGNPYNAASYTCSQMMTGDLRY